MSTSSSRKEFYILALGHGAGWITPQFTEYYGNHLAIDRDWYMEDSYRKVVIDNRTGESFPTEIMCSDAITLDEGTMKMHLQKSDGVIFCYDFFKPESFETLKSLVSPVRRVLMEENRSIPMAMLGVNYDRRAYDEIAPFEGRNVSEDTISAYASTVEMPYYETMHTKITNAYDQIALAFETLISRANAILEEEKMINMSRTERIKYEKEKEKRILKHCKEPDALSSSSSSSTSSNSSTPPPSSRTQAQCSVM